jgi:hypothetical protein
VPETPSAQSGRAPRPTFDVEISGVWTLQVREIWPDGDAPENPTVDDVIEVMKRTTHGYVSNLIRDWNLEPENVTVNGKSAGLR